MAKHKGRKRSIPEEIRFAVALGLLLLLIADLTILKGQVPNWILITGYGGWCLWIAATAESERSRDAAESVSEHGLRFLSKDSSQLPEDIPWRLLPGGSGAASNIREAMDATRRMYVFDAVVREEKTWYDDEPSIYRFAVCCLRLRGSLPEFHVEVGRGWKRLRGPWPEPRMSLSKDRKGPVSADPLPAYMRDAIFHPGMLDWLTTIGPCQIAVSGDWLSFATKNYLRSPTLLMQTATGFEDRVRGEAFTPPRAETT